MTKLFSIMDYTLLIHFSVLLFKYLRNTLKNIPNLIS